MDLTERLEFEPTTVVSLSSAARALMIAIESTRSEEVLTCAHNAIDEIRLAIAAAVGLEPDDDEDPEDMETCGNA